MFKSDLLCQLQHNLTLIDSPTPADAAVLVAITNEIQPKILLTKRASHLRQHAGEVSFVGGKRDADDIDDVATALREAQEEIGLVSHQLTILGTLPIQRSKAGLRVRPIVAVIEPNLPLKIEPDEIDYVFYFALDAFLHAPIQPYEMTYQNQIWVASSVLVTENLDGGIRQSLIWGLTANILLTLLKQGLGYQKAWRDFYRKTHI